MLRQGWGTAHYKPYKAASSAVFVVVVFFIGSFSERTSHEELFLSFSERTYDELAFSAVACTHPSRQIMLRASAQVLAATANLTSHRVLAVEALRSLGRSLWEKQLLMCY